MYLRTFGGLSLDPGTGAASPPSIGPRRLALLAIVAAAGRAGITREKVVGILWPESDEEQARHTLSQTLYMLRREAGASWITGTANLRIDPALGSDIAEFQDALSAGQLDRAALLHSGPFLDGFYLVDAPEFEQWVEEMRARQLGAARKALESLARRASESNALAEATGWYQRLLEIDQLNASYAAGYIRALIGTSEHTRALDAAREYEARVRHQLEADPDPAIAALVAPLRAAVPAPRAKEREHGLTSDAVPAIAPPHTSAGGAARQTVAAETPTTRAKAVPGPADARASPPRVHRGLLVPVLMGSGVLAFLLWQVGGSLRASERIPPTVAVGVIQSRDSSNLGPILREMLATNLARLNGLTVVSTSRLAALASAADSGTPAATANAAQRAGADEIIEGSLDHVGGHLVANLRRVAIRSGVVVQGYTIRAADVLSLTDSLTSAVATDLGVEVPTAASASVRTRSSVAHALYEQGLRAFHSGRYESSSQLMYAALGRDSTFAMAAAYAWRANLALQRFEAARRDLAEVERLAARATGRDRLLIETTVAHYAILPLTDYLFRARQLTERYPDESAGHVLFGKALASNGEWLRAVDAFNRAIAIDSAASVSGEPYCTVCEAFIAGRDAYLWVDSAAAAERMARRFIAMRPQLDFGHELLVEPLLRQKRRGEAEKALARAGELSGMSLLVDHHALNRDLIRSGRLDELESRILAEVRTSPPEMIGELPWLLAFVLRNQGRLREARDLMATGAVPGTDRKHDRYPEPTTLAIVALEAGNPLDAARLFLGMLDGDRAGGAGPGAVARNLSWHMTLAGTAFAAAGDTAMVRALADSVQRIGRASSIARDYRLHHFLLGLLLQRQNRHAEAVESFRRSIYSVTDGFTRTNLEMARSLILLQRYREAIAVLQPALRGGVDGMNSYVTHTELQEALAHAFFAAGMLDSAQVHYAAVERAWRRADPQFADRYRVAKERSAPRSR